MGNANSNLFDLSARGAPKKKTKSAAQEPARLLPQKAIVDTEASQLLNRGKEIHRSLSAQLELLFKKSGNHPADLKSYVSNPKNFTADQWLEMQTKKEDLEMRLLGLSKAELQEKKAIALNTQSRKTRQGKTLGARRHWIDMR
jgi:hypothetical protein